MLSKQAQRTTRSPPQAEGRGFETRLPLFFPHLGDGHQRAIDLSGRQRRLVPADGSVLIAAWPFPVVVPPRGEIAPLER